MTKSHNVASFVLRFKQEVSQDIPDEPQIQWQGHIQHVQGNEENRFTNVAEAIAFMQHHLVQITAETLAGGKGMTQAKVFLESFKLWERFAYSYVDLMLQTMQQGLKQTDALTERLNQIREQLLNSWRLPNQTPDNQEEIVEILGNLQEQVEYLSERVKTLEDMLLQQDRQES